MGREISDVFKAKTRVGKRKVLDKFDISKEDKNKFLNGIDSVGGGDSGESGGEGSNIEYLDVSGMEYSPGSEKHSLLMASFLIKVKINNKVVINTYGIGTITNGDTVRSNTIAIAVDFSTIVSNGTEKITLGETISSTVDIDSVPRITKEQFYSLE